MTDPVSPAVALPSADLNYPSRASPPVLEPTKNTTRVEVSRAEAAPVFVYRVLDSATGRTLAEIPRESMADTQRPGKLLDTWA